MSAMSKTIAVRIEGGIGDHILGMRLLYFIHQRFPKHKIIVYSDCCGNQTQLELTRMSPFVSKVIPVYHKKNSLKMETWGRLNNIKKKYIDMMMTSDFFFDAWGPNFFLGASRILDTSFLEIFQHKPELIIPNNCKSIVKETLKPYKGHVFVGLNIAKFDLCFFKKNKKMVLMFLEELLKDKRVIILNFYTSKFTFPHWPEVLRNAKELREKDSLKIAKMWNISERVVPLVDFSLPTVAAFLKKCNYFIGVDNGIKHLAWAMGIPHTFFIARIPKRGDILLWMPDYHRALLFSCTKKDLSNHILTAKRAIRSSLLPTDRKALD